MQEIRERLEMKGTDGNTVGAFFNIVICVIDVIKRHIKNGAPQSNTRNPPCHCF